MSDKYILADDGRTPVKADLMTWARWYEQHDKVRAVARTDTPNGDVSTVFLGLDHSFGHGEPLLFETMIFGGPHDGYQERTATWAQAEAEHAKAVALVNEARG